MIVPKGKWRGVDLMQWFYVDGGQQAGPVDEATIDGLIASGVIVADTLVWRDGWADWRRAADSEFADRFTAGAATAGFPPPLAPRPETASAAAESGRSLAWLWFSFRGRATRIDYWVRFVVISLGIGVAAALIERAVGTADPETGFGPIVAIMQLALLWPSLAVLVKRWHDRNRSGWFVLISLIPVIGTIWTLVECGCMRGTPGPNRFGPDPLAGRQ